MQTDELIADLSTDLKPVRRNTVERLLAGGLMVGAAVAFMLMAFWLGMRPDMHLAMRGESFWMKACYTILVALLGFVLASGAGRPGTQFLSFALLLPFAIAMIGGVGMAQMMHKPPNLRAAMFFGGSYTVCPWLILANLCADPRRRSRRHAAHGADATDAGRSRRRYLGGRRRRHRLRAALHGELGPVRGRLVQPRHTGRRVDRGCGGAASPCVGDHKNKRKQP